MKGFPVIVKDDYRIVEVIRRIYLKRFDLFQKVIDRGVYGAQKIPLTPHQSCPCQRLTGIHPDHDLVEIGSAQKVVSIGIKDNFIFVPLTESERTGAHRMQAKLLKRAFSLEEMGRQDPHLHVVYKRG